MKKCDFGIVFLHWLMAISLIGVAITGLLYIYEGYRPFFAWLFPPKNIGPIHIYLSVMVVIFLSTYLLYLKQSNMLNRLQLHLKGIYIKGQIRWKYVTNILYWLLFLVIGLETISGILLTKLINWDTLAQMFLIPKTGLVFLHMHLVWFILAFPVIHVIIHWMDGGRRKLASMLHPMYFPRRPTLVEIMVTMKNENTELRKKVKKYELASRSTDSSRS